MASRARHTNRGGEPIAPPPLALKLFEPGRAALELGATLAVWPLLQAAPRGDGHPVLVLPGLVATDTSTALLRRYLAGLGHDVHGWELGRNLGPRQGVVESLLGRVESLQARHGRRVSLVGWSLGGVYARVIAGWRPELLRCVVMLGSPVAGGAAGTNAQRLYRWVSRGVQPDARAAEALRRAPTVPISSIWSRSDGIVSWRSSVQPGGPRAENIEVVASHVGLGAHPAVLYAVADRLAQPEGGWQPFARQARHALVYPDPARG